MAFTTFLPVSFSFAKHRIGTLHNFVTQLGKVKRRNVVFFYLLFIIYLFIYLCFMKYFFYILQGQTTV